MVRNRRGQLVVEYILLVVVAAVVAATLVKLLASRSESNPGVIVEAWKNIQKEIGNDLPDKCAGSDCRAP